jgi:hypothetical protein
MSSRSDAREEGQNHDKDFNIVVNGRAKKVPTQLLTFDDVVQLAFATPPEGDVIYTVVFHNADQHPSNGTLVAGRSVTIRNGTKFDVKHAVRS